MATDAMPEAILDKRITLSPAKFAVSEYHVPRFEGN
jgi:hypothetical protein